MNEPALTEAVKTDLPSRKPNRRRRLALRFAALVAAVSTLCAAYWFTRPPELVWWRSPPVAGSGKHVRILVPQGWTVQGSYNYDYKNPKLSVKGYLISPVDNRPRILRRLIPMGLE